MPNEDEFEVTEEFSSRNPEIDPIFDVNNEFFEEYYWDLTSEHTSLVNPIYFEEIDSTLTTGKPLFDATIDRSNNGFYIVYSSDTGIHLLSKYSDSSWSEKDLLVARNNSFFPKNARILVDTSVNQIYLIYLGFSESSRISLIFSVFKWESFPDTDNELIINLVSSNVLASVELTENRTILDFEFWWTRSWKDPENRFLFENKFPINILYSIADRNNSEIHLTLVHSQENSHKMYSSGFDDLKNNLKSLLLWNESTTLNTQQPLLKPYFDIFFDPNLTNRSYIMICFNKTLWLHQLDNFDNQINFDTLKINFPYPHFLNDTLETKIPYYITAVETKEIYGVTEDSSTFPQVSFVWNYLFELPYEAYLRYSYAYQINFAHISFLDIKAMFSTFSLNDSFPLNLSFLEKTVPGGVWMGGKFGLGYNTIPIEGLSYTHSLVTSSSLDLEVAFIPKETTPLLMFLGSIPNIQLHEEENANLQQALYNFTLRTSIDERYQNSDKLNQSLDISEKTKLIHRSGVMALGSEYYELIGSGLIEMKSPKIIQGLKNEKNVIFRVFFIQKSVLTNTWSLEQIEYRIIKETDPIPIIITGVGVFFLAIGFIGIFWFRTRRTLIQKLEKSSDNEEL
ncbi:MAG: EGFR-like transmembrane domain-containing protein [Candidatus Hodarchaeales archaeon]